MIRRRCSVIFTIVKMPFTKMMALLDWKFDLTRSEWYTMIVLSTVTLVNGISTTMLSPFYPIEAEKRGASESEYGLVLGAHDLAAFFACMIYGKYMDKLNTSYLVIFGVVFSGVINLISGLLYLVDSHLEFIGMYFALSTLGSLGYAACFTAAYTTVAVVLSSNAATSFAVLECVDNLGFALGPAFGGYLYEVGGFQLPFFTMGGLLLLLGVIAIAALPRVEGGSKVEKNEVKICSLLKLMPVIIGVTTLTAAYLSLGFYQTILEPHLRQFNLRPVTVGAIFSITSLTYILTTPLVGRLCDTMMSPMKTIVFGSLLIIVSFALVGPLPFLPINTALWMVYLGMVLHGLGMSCSVVPGFIVAIRSAVKHGLPNDVATYGMITAFTTSSVCLGDFIGPTVAGVLYDTVGFRQGTLLVIAVYTVLIVFVVWALYVESKSDAPSLEKGQINRGFSLPEATDGLSINRGCLEKPDELSKRNHSSKHVNGSTREERYTNIELCDKTISNYKYRTK